VKECLERRREVRPVPLEEEIERLEGEGILHADGAAKLKQDGLRGGYLRTLPGIHQCDGFYAALIVRD
jgi:16S rRNA (cytosine967-C5)-methyltransferase